MSAERRSNPLHGADDPQAFAAHHPGVGGADPDRDFRGPIAGAGRPRAVRTDELPRDAPAVQAMARMGKDFKESDSDSFAMIVLEGQQPLGDDARTYYDGLIREFRNDPQHMSSMCRICGGIDSRRRARKAPTARPSMCN